MKKILFINGGKKRFAEEFHKACSDTSLKCVDLRTRHTVIFAEQGGVEVYHRDERIDFDGVKYAFFRVKGMGTHMTSIFSRIVRAQNIPFNDQTNAEHTLGDEKVTQMVQFALSGVPIPKTVICSAESYRLNKKTISQKITFPCVLKTSGSKGKQVWKISDQNELEKSLFAIVHELAIIQEYIPNTFDIRALYFYGDCFGAIKRASTDGFYNNVAKGGQTSVIELTPEEDTIAKKACEVMEIDFGGVDIVRSEHGPLVFEVNKGPQIYGFEDTTGKDVPALLVKKIADLFLKK